MIVRLDFLLHINRHQKIVSAYHVEFKETLRSWVHTQHLPYKGQNKTNDRRERTESLVISFLLHSRLKTN